MHRYAGLSPFGPLRRPHDSNRSRCELPDGIQRFDRALWEENRLHPVTAPIGDDDDIDPEGKKRLDAAKFDVDLPMLLIKIPGADMISIGVTPQDTVGKIKQRVRYELPDWATHVIQPDGRVVSDSTPVAELKVVLRSANELNAMLYLDHNNRTALLKQSSLTIQSRAAVTVRSKHFNHFILLLVFLNTITLGSDHYPASDEFKLMSFYGELLRLLPRLNSSIVRSSGWRYADKHPPFLRGSLPCLPAQLRLHSRPCSQWSWGSSGLRLAGASTPRPSSIGSTASL